MHFALTVDRTQQRCFLHNRSKPASSDEIQRVQCRVVVNDDGNKVRVVSVWVARVHEKLAAKLDARGEEVSTKHQVAVHSVPPFLLVCFGKLEGAGEERPAPVADAWCLMGHDNAARTKALTNVPPCIAPHHLWCRLITTIAVACVVIITVIPRTGLLVGTARCSGSCSSKAGLLTVGVELFYGVEVSRNQRLSTRGPWELQHKGAESRAMWQWGAEEQGGVAKIVRGCSCVHGCPP